MLSTLDQLTSLDLAATVDPVIRSIDPEIRRTSLTAFQVRDASGPAGGFRSVIDVTNKRWGWSTIDGTFTPGVMWDGETQGGDFFMRGTVYSSGLDDEVEWVARKAHGTKAAPLALGDNSDILEWEVNGYDGVGFTAERGSMTIRTSQAWAVGANGVNIAFRVTANGTAAAYDALLIQNDGDLDIQAGGLEIGNVQVFESDRDLAVSLIPNVDSTLDVGSPSRRFDQIVGNFHEVYAGLGDAVPSSRLQSGALLFGPGGAGALDTRLRRTGTSKAVIDANAAMERFVFDGATSFFGVNDFGTTFAPAFPIHVQDGGGIFATIDIDGYGGAAPQFLGRANAGTPSAPAAIGSPLVIAAFSGAGFDGAAYSFLGDGGMAVASSQPFAVGAHGTELQFYVTLNGTAALYAAALLQNDGDLDILVGGLEIGNVQVFEADRDLAIDLIPNADDTLDLGSSTRRFDVGFVTVLNHYRFEFYGDQLENPNNADWTVNALAPASADTINAALTVRRFDDTVEEGVGFTLSIPANAIEIRFTFRHRAQTAPGGAVTTQPRLYRRTRADNAAWGAWSALFAFTALSLPASTNWQDDTQVVTLATLGLTAGQVAQFELTRDPADGLTGDWVLHELMVEFL